jgi:hypothetical protein
MPRSGERQALHYRRNCDQELLAKVELKIKIKTQKMTAAVWEHSSLHNVSHIMNIGETKANGNISSRDYIYI